MSTPARDLRDRVEAMFKPGDELAFATDDQSETAAVLLAIARPSWCGVFAIDRAEYTLDSALQLAALLGFHQAERAPAIERAIHAAAHQPPKDKTHANPRPHQRRARHLAHDHKAGADA